MDEMNFIGSDVAVLLSTYNGSKYLQQQLNSITQQSFRPSQLFVRDDGSTDETLEVVRAWARDQKEIGVRIKEGGHVGPSQSFGLLMQNALTDMGTSSSKKQYFAFSDQDDFWLPTKLEVRIQELTRIYPKTPLLVHCDLLVVDSELRNISDSFWKYQGIRPNRHMLSHLLMQNTVTGCAMILNKELAELSLPFPKECLMHDWWIAMVASVFGKIGVVCDSLVLYRQHATNQTGARRFGVTHLIRNMRRQIDRQRFRGKMNKHISQAEAFLKRYSNLLSSDCREMLVDFVSFWSKKCVARKAVLVRHDILPSGFLSKVGVIIKA